MARPALEPGETGSLSSTRSKTTAGWRSEVRVRDLDGEIRRVSASGPTRGSSEKALRTKLARRSVPTAGRAELTAETSVADLLRYWDTGLDRQKLAESSRWYYRRSARIIAPELRDPEQVAKGAKHRSKAARNLVPLPGIGALRLRQVTVQRLGELLEAIEERHGATEAKRCRVVIKAAFQIGVRFGAMPHNLAILTDAVRVEIPEPVALAPEEVRALLVDLRADEKAVKADLPDVIELLAVTGLRTGELLGLRWQDVDLGATEPTLTVSGTVVMTGGLHWQPEPKSRTSVRTVRLPAKVAADLMGRLVDSGSEWVVPSSTGTLRNPHNLRRAWRSFTDRHQRWASVTPKTLRKSCATWIRDDLGIEAASAQLGHSGVQVTERHYAERARRGPDVAALLGGILTGETASPAE